MSSQYEFHDPRLIHVFLWPLKLAWRLFYLYGLLSLLCVGGFILASKYWWPDGIHSAFDIYRRTHLSALSVTDVIGMAEFLAKTADLTYWLVFQVTHLQNVITNLDRGAPASVVNQSIADSLLRPWLTELQIAALAIRTFGARVALLAASWPAFLIGYGVGFIDGLVERRIRSACAGRESSSIYHRAKYGQLTTGAMACLVYVCLPYYLDVRWVVFPLALVLGYLARTQWKFYKKYV